MRVQGRGNPSTVPYRYLGTAARRGAAALSCAALLLL